MNASHRNLLAVALASLLLSPVAWAEKGQSLGRAVDRVANDRTENDAATRNAPERTMREIDKGATEQVNHAAPPPSPPQSQGAEHAAGHSSVVQRDLWVRLDTNADGRISTSEGTADAGFAAAFAAMDSDEDGFVTENEYRATAKLDGDRGGAAGGVNAASGSSAAMRDAMSRLDVNADGAISRSESEADAAFSSSFASIDANSDGLVSGDEYRAWSKERRK